MAYGKKGNPIGVTPNADYHEYVDENLKVVEIDYDQMDGVDCESDFKSRDSESEGVSGLKAIDTTYENYSESIVESPRSDRDDSGKSLRDIPIESSTPRKRAPVPMDLYRYPHRRT